MHTKLTLRIEEPLIKAAKKYSKAHGKSVSQLIADYLFLITQKTSHKMPKQKRLPPITRSLKGILHGKEVREEDYKKYIRKKYK
jgi:hypothetical protein